MIRGRLVGRRHSFLNLKVKIEKAISLPEIISRFKPTRVIIFGSRIKGDAKEADIDVIIVSEFFKDVLFLKRMSLLVKTVIRNI